MPHVKIRPGRPLPELFEALERFSHRDETGVQKVVEFFMERGEARILAEALVAEGGLPRHFFLSIQHREGAVILRCYESTDPEKTPAVKRLILRAGKAVLDLCEGSELDPCNLDKEAEELGLIP